MSLTSDFDKQNELNPQPFSQKYAEAVFSGDARNRDAYRKSLGNFEITPTNDLVIIRKHSVEDLKSPMGILLPPVEESADTPWKGTVVAVGPGKPAKLSGAGENVVKALEMVCKQYNVTPDQNWGAHHWQVAAAALKDATESVQRVPMQVKVGDVVVFSRNGHQTFQINGEVVFCMGEASILGVIDHE